MPKTQKIRLEPRMSLNKLGEYMVAPAIRRLAILKDQKRPQPFKVIYYEPANTAITRFLLNGGNDVGQLLEERNRLWALGSSATYSEQRFKANAEAITSFLDSYDVLPVGVVEARMGSNMSPMIRIAGVDISMRPEIVIRARSNRLGDSIGAIKLYFSKNAALDENSGAYIGALLHQYAQENLGELGQAVFRNSSVLDVFQGAQFSAPRNHRRRFADIQAACVEIGSRWKSI